jgi:hypothetical protein
MNFKANIIATLVLSFFAPSWAMNKFELKSMVDRVAKDVTEQLEGRKLQTISSSDFRDVVCEPFMQEYTSAAPLGSSCSCSGPSRYSITCYIPQACEFLSGCGGDVCFSSETTLTFTQSGSSLILSEAEYDFDYSGADYSGERIRVYLSGGSSKCEVAYSIGSAEYKCDSCSVCSNTDEVSLDCDNIQAGATTNGCVSVTDSENTAINVCLPGDAPIPTRGANDSSGDTQVVTGAMAIVGVVAAALVVVL